MELIHFDDHCEIIRNITDDGGNIDLDYYDEPVEAETIYSGKCCYQSGGQTYQSVSVRNDAVYLPGNAVMVMEGDTVKIRAKSGRLRTGIVKTVRDIELPLTHALYTKIELKQSIGE